MTMLFSPVPGWRSTRISAFDFTMSRGSTTLATNPLMSSSILLEARLPVLKILCSELGTVTTYAAMNKPTLHVFPKRRGVWHSWEKKRVQR